MNRPAISPTPVTHSQNSQATTNNDNFHSNDHPNFLLGEEQNQDTNLNDTLDALENSGKTSDEATSISNNDESETESANFDDEDNNEQLMSQSEKAKWVLANDPLEAMELYFESLGFQDMAQFYGMKNMGGLK